MMPNFIGNRGSNTLARSTRFLHYIFRPQSQRFSWGPIVSFPALTLCPAIQLVQKTGRLGVVCLQTQQQTSYSEVPTHKPSMCFVVHNVQKNFRLPYVSLKWIQGATAIYAHSCPLRRYTPLRLIYKKQYTTSNQGRCNVHYTI